ncbi:MAG: rRNA maturation RNase YbeY [Planctomycetota bacterium]|jgi:probable rRNA maturation factor
MVPVERDHGIVVHIAGNFPGIRPQLPKLKNLVTDVCKRFDLSKAAVSIAIVGDAEIRRINRRFLNRDRSTDCLSFDLSDEQPPGKPDEKSAKSFEVVVNGEMAVREAQLRGHSSGAELALYITHGLLHNLGFDDSTPNRAKKMHEAEDEILQQHGYGLVYYTNGN